jgi:hypothetical protein
MSNLASAAAPGTGAFKSKRAKGKKAKSGEVGESFEVGCSFVVRWMAG